VTHGAVRPIHWLLLALSLLFQTSAVILGKTAALAMGKPTVTAFLTNRWYLAGLACLGLQAFCWQLVLRRMSLSVAYLATSLSYLLILAASRFIFVEPITRFNVIGSVVIVVGVWLVVNERRP
jgi:undecaprenyl phosphate-alpha-L-ara4N flippase subunit ArnE